MLTFGCIECVRRKIIEFFVDSETKNPRQSIIQNAYVGIYTIAHKDFQRVVLFLFNFGRKPYTHHHRIGIDIVDSTVLSNFTVVDTDLFDISIHQWFYIGRFLTRKKKKYQEKKKKGCVFHNHKEKKGR